jgi:hypothetical protein
MKPSDRRFAQRFRLTTPLYIREWKTLAPEKEINSVNVSEGGVYFETETPPRQGAMVQIRLSMPMEITGEKTVEWRCTGKVVGIRPTCPPGLSHGVGVRFDYYEVLQIPVEAPGPTFASSFCLRNDS